MKKLIILLFPIVTSAQQSYNSLDSVEYYFIQELNAYRRQTYSKIPDLIRSEQTSNASLHHTKYLVNMESEDGLHRLISHDEEQSALGLTYKGTDTLLYSFSDRRAYYDSSNIFGIYGEVVQMYGAYERTLIVLGQREVAHRILKTFLESPKHKDILDMYEYTHIGISIIQSVNSDAFYTCILPSVLKSSKYLRHPNSIYPFYYGNKLQDIQ